MKINPTIQADFYKMDHKSQYPPNTTLIYSNLTPRKSRNPEIQKMVFFGLQYFIKEYLIKQWNEDFFGYIEIEKSRNIRGGVDQRNFIISRYKRMMDNTLGPDKITTTHLEELWDLGYLPIEIKALPEGSLVSMGVPCLTIKNTLPQFYWLTNFFETILSTTIWGPCTSATIAYEYRKLLDQYAKETSSIPEFVQWQGHDFSMRGMFGLEAACLSSAGHLLSFTGTDTIPAIQFLEDYYNADITKELVGASVPATEHSVMCAGGKDFELDTYRRLITETYPSGIISIVSDTWDLWNVLTNYIPRLKSDILFRDGKVVIRPDSGDPVDILCGAYWWDDDSEEIFWNDGDVYEQPDHPINKGVIEILWDIFGGTINEKGYKELDPHIGAIYGDSITLSRAGQICERLEQKGFASTNVILGIGSYTYQYNTRDTFGMAVKSTYCEIDGIPREIFKDPITDDGTKKSAKGLLRVVWDPFLERYQLLDQQTWEQESSKNNCLKTVFKDGKLIIDQTLKEIRKTLYP